jgi:hypothetical protein
MPRRLQGTFATIRNRWWFLMRVVTGDESLKQRGQTKNGVIPAHQISKIPQAVICGKIDPDAIQGSLGLTCRAWHAHSHQCLILWPPYGSYETGDQPKTPWTDQYQCLLQHNNTTPHTAVWQLRRSRTSAVVTWHRWLWLSHLWASQWGSWWKDFPIWQTSNRSSSDKACSQRNFSHVKSRQLWSGGRHALNATGTVLKND